MSSLRDQILAGARQQSRPPAVTGGATNWQTSTQKKHASEALGVHPSQIKEATEHLREHGVMADFDSSGRCIITSQKQFQDVARACGMKSARDGYEVITDAGAKTLTGRKKEWAKREFQKTVSQWED